MNDVIVLLPKLMVLIILNIILGMYNNIDKLQQNFEWKRLIVGIIKALIITGTFVGLAYCFDGTTALSDLGVTPLLLMNASVVVYATKVVIAFCDIMGIKDKIKFGDNSLK